MRILRTGMVQISCTADVGENLSRLEAGIREAASQGAKLVVLQELHNSLYFCQSENAKLCDLAEPIPGPSTERFGALARELGIVLVLSLFERRTPGIYHNTAVVLENDGSIAGKYRKMHIPDDPLFYEKFYFTPGDMGFQPIKTSVGTLGVLVCWDQWYPEAARAMALAGAEVLIYPTAIGGVPTDPDWEQAQQRQAWQLVQRGHAVANGLPVVTVNRTGVEPDPSGLSSGIDFWGHSFACGAQGELLTEFEKDEKGVRVVDLDLEQSEYVRRGWPFLRDRRIDAYDVLLKRFND
ncbi:MAG: carbon-nitrogen hydrolase [Bacteroidales bacterium]|nr:carbon-nitrogen hydrolase [Bacteroidales bacterium]